MISDLPEIQIELCVLCLLTVLFSESARKATQREEVAVSVTSENQTTGFGVQTARPKGRGYDGG